MTRTARYKAYEDPEKLLQELEVEYGVVIDWNVTPGVTRLGELGSRISCSAVPTPWGGWPNVYWELSDVVPYSTPASLVDRAHLLLLSKLGLELQLCRTFGLDAGDYVILSPNPT